MRSIEVGSKILIFCETKRGVEDITRRMRQDGYHGVRGIHGDKTQAERDQVYRDFKEGVNNVLVATDVASRGLDVKDIKYVINHDMPNGVEDYVHRIGRTARAGATGKSYSFFTKKNMAMAPELIKLLKDAKQPVPDSLTEMAEYSRNARDMKRDSRTFR